MVITLESHPMLEGSRLYVPESRIVYYLCWSVLIELTRDKHLLVKDIGSPSLSGLQFKVHQDPPSPS